MTVMKPPSLPLIPSSRPIASFHVRFLRHLLVLEQGLYMEGELDEAEHVQEHGGSTDRHLDKPSSVVLAPF